MSIPRLLILVNLVDRVGREPLNVKAIEDDLLVGKRVFHCTNVGLRHVDRDVLDL